jgi:protein-tyrosine phosphatase
LIEGTWNARVFGALRPWLLRSAALDGLTVNGRRTLEGLGVGTVIDLRGPAERGVPGHRLPVRRIPIFGRRGEPDRRAPLEVVYRMALESHGEALAEAVAAIAEADGVAAVHCAAGKDRTGLVVALTLAVAGCERDAIVHDYALSGARQPTFLRRAAREQMAWEGIEAPTPAGREFMRRGLDSPPDVMEGVLDLVDLLDGPRSYLMDRGVTSDQIDAIRAKASVGGLVGVPERVAVFA